MELGYKTPLRHTLDHDFPWSGTVFGRVPVRRSELLEFNIGSPDALRQRIGCMEDDGSASVVSLPNRDVSGGSGLRPPLRACRSSLLGPVVCEYAVELVAPDPAQFA